jgi:uncharacterized repeat protein (TIGR01451 family)
MVTITVAIAMDTTIAPDACDAAYRFANEVNVEASDLCGIRLALDPTSDPVANEVAVDCPALKVVTTAEPERNLEPCEEVTYTIRIGNTGGASSQLYDILIRDEVPEHFQVIDIRVNRNGTALNHGTHYSGTNPADAPLAGPLMLEWFFDQTLPEPVLLAPDELITIQVTGYFDSNACDTDYTMAVEASAGADQCGLPKTPTEDSILEVPTATIICPDVIATKTHDIDDDTVEPCEQITYTVTLTNPESATGPLYINQNEEVVSDAIPVNWQFVRTVDISAAGNLVDPENFTRPGEPTDGAEPLTWPYTGASPLVLLPGESFVLRLRFGQSPQDDNQAVCTDVFQNMASVQARDLCGTLYTDTAQADLITVLCPSVVVTKTENTLYDTVEPCEGVTYTATLRNIGTEDLYLNPGAVVMTDGIPENWEFVRTVSVTVRRSGSAWVFCMRLPSRPPGWLISPGVSAPEQGHWLWLHQETVEVVYVVRAVTTDLNQEACADASKTACQLQAQDLCGTVYAGNAQADELTVICPELTVTKTENIDDDTVEPCEEVTYTVTLTNPASATGPLYLNPNEEVARDAIPVNWEFVRTMDATAAGSSVALGDFTRPGEPTAGEAFLTWTYTGANPLILQPGESFILRYVIRAITTDDNQEVCGIEFQNMATVQARDLCGTLHTDTAQADPIRVLCPSVTVTKTENIPDDTVKPCEEVTYTATLTNRGAEDLYLHPGAVVMTDGIPENWEFVRTISVTVAGVDQPGSFETPGEPTSEQLP